MSKRKICIAVTYSLIACLLVYELFLNKLVSARLDPKVSELVNMTVTRALGGAIFLAILIYLGFRVLNPLQRPFGRTILFSLPAIAVVLNNLPIYPLITGIARVDQPFWMVLLLAAECFCVALFEEACFRGVILLSLMEKRRETTKGRLLSVLITSAIFGAVHLVNLFLGSSPVAVLMQIGYSFLIGAMCSVVLFYSANLWLCVALHATFNFCGALVPTCGSGVIWEPVTVTVTVILALFTTVYLTLAFFRIKSGAVDRIYGDKNAKSVGEIWENS